MEDFSHKQACMIVKEGFLMYRDAVLCIRSISEMLTVIQGSGKVSYSSSSSHTCVCSTEYISSESVWSRIEFEDELSPSFDALWHHWQRTCWVSDMWNQAARNHVGLLDITQYSWKIIECDWESVKNRKAVRQQLGLLF